MKDNNGDEIQDAQPCRNVFSDIIEETHTNENPFQSVSNHDISDDAPQFLTQLSEKPPDIERKPYINSPDITLVKKPLSNMADFKIFQRYKDSIQKQCTMPGTRKRDISKKQHITKFMNSPSSNKPGEKAKSKIVIPELKMEGNSPKIRSCCIVF